MQIGMKGKGTAFFETVVLFTNLCCLPAIDGSQIGSRGIEALMSHTNILELRCCMSVKFKCPR